MLILVTGSRDYTDADVGMTFVLLKRHTRNSLGTAAMADPPSSDITTLPPNPEDTDMSEHRGRRFIVPRTASSGHGPAYRSQPLRDIRPLADPLHIIEIAATRTAMIDEPEAVGPAIVDAYSERARTEHQIRHARETEQHQQDRQLLTAEQRLANAQACAKQKHINLSGEFHAIRTMLDQAKRGGRHEPPAAIRMLERIEDHLDGPAAA